MNRMMFERNCLDYCTDYIDVGWACVIWCIVVYCAERFVAGNI